MLYQHLRFEIQPGAQSQILMPRPGIAIAAAVRAASIWIYAVAKPDVRAIVFGDNRLRLVRDIFGRRPSKRGQVLLIVLDVLQVWLHLYRQVRVFRLNRCAATFHRARHSKKLPHTTNTVMSCSPIWYTYRQLIVALSLRERNSRFAERVD